MTKLLQQYFLFFIVVVIPGHKLGNSQVSVNRTIGPTLVFNFVEKEEMHYVLDVFNFDLSDNRVSCP